MKQDHKCAIRIRKLLPDDPFLSRAKETQDRITQRAAKISHEELPASQRDLQHWLQAEAELLQPVTLEVRETKNELLIAAKIPGFRENEVELLFDSGCLYISGIALGCAEEGQDAPMYSEWRSNTILREFRLPMKVDPNLVNAQLRRGILEIVIVKPTAQ